MKILIPPSMRAVIFDLDGVLVDSQHLHNQAYIAAFGDQGIEIRNEDLTPLVAAPMAKIITTLLEKKHTSLDLLPAVQAAKIKYFYDLIPSIKPTPEVVDLLDRLKGQFALAIASSSHHDTVKAILDQTQLAPYFAVVVAGDEVENGKPAPDIFLAAAEQINIPPDQCAVIEDSTNGIVGAQKAGMFTIGYRNRNSGPQDLTQTDAAINHFNELIVA